MKNEGISRRNFLRQVTISGIALPFLSGIYFPESGLGAIATKREDQIFRFPEDLKQLTKDQRLHFPKITIPPVIENGRQAPISVEMDHPMERGNYVKSIQIVNYRDPVAVKGQFFFTPANGQAYLSTQIRLDGGTSTVWVIAECSHGKWATSKTLKVAVGGC